MLLKINARLLLIVVIVAVIDCRPAENDDELDDEDEEYSTNLGDGSISGPEEDEEADPVLLQAREDDSIGDQYDYDDDKTLMAEQKHYIGNDEVCQSQTCKAVAARFESMMNDSADPCEDFYQFTCGGWLRDNKLPPDKDKWGIFNWVSKKLSESLKNLLIGPIKNKHEAVIKVRNLYQGCVDEETRDRNGYSGIYKHLLNSYPWPILDKDENSWSGDKYDWYDHLAYLTREFEAKYIINMVIDFDKNNTKYRVIYLETPTFGINRKQLIKPDIDKNVTMKAYQTMMLKMITEIGRNFTGNANFKPREKEVADMIHFERQLAAMSSDPSTFRNQFKSYGSGRLSFNTFQKQYKYDVFDYVKKLFSKTGLKFDRKEKMMVVMDKKYYGNLTSMIPEKPNNRLKRTIANYLNWRAVRDWGTMTTRKIRQIDFEYQKDVNPELKEPAALWESCIDVVKHNLGYAVGRLFTDHNFKEHYKRDILNMIKYIRKGFKKILHDNKWMDKETKRVAKVKLDKMIYAIGYPDFIKVDKQLSRFYEGLGVVEPKKFFDSLIMIKSWEMNRRLKKLKDRIKTRTEIDWSSSPAVVNAFYNAHINRLTFPAGVLQPPFYQFGAPMETNIGAIGSAIGHELTHGFDDKGSQFDEFGNLYPWWANETKKEFDRNKVCFVNQYSAYHDDVAKMNLNGKSTIGENIADNGALREIYNALQIYYKCEGKRSRLPGKVMSKYTPEQLLFISWGTIWCGHMTKKKMADHIMHNHHAPSKYRVIVPMSNSVEFAHAFQCKKGAPMNPKKKCVLW